MGSSIGGLVGGIAGSVVPGLGTGLGASLGSGIGGLIGGSAQGRSAAGAAGAAGSSVYGAGQQAQQMAQFRPVGITTNFGKSSFEFDPYGQLTSAGYTLDPRLQGIQGRLLSQAEAYRPEDIAAAAQPLMGGAQSLFGLGQQYISQSPEEAAQRYVSQQQALLQPSREAQLSGVRSRLFGTGRGGLGVQTGTGSAPASPEMQAYYNALAQQDLQLASQAQQEAQKQIAFGAGLFQQGGGLLGQVPALTTAGYSPLQTQLGLASTTESMGQQALDIGSALGARQSSAGANAGQLGLLGAARAAPYQVEQQSYNPLAQILGGSSKQLGAVGGQLGNWFSGLIGGGGASPAGAFINSPGFNVNSGGAYGVGTGGFE